MTKRAAVSARQAFETRANTRPWYPPYCPVCSHDLYGSNYPATHTDPVIKGTCLYRIPR